ncbi:hypothetical protein DFH29DRAFT_1006602 [Suillus ampliporus]|nr:hypothetical protein DFH29DRAFT_1006602 [Suillus ampliporus]
MQQSLRQTQTFNLAGNIISLNLQIEIAGNANQRSEHEGLAGLGKADVEKGLASAENKETLHLPKYNHETHEEESIDKLKERLRLTELGCLRLQAQYQMYRLRWLEEHYRARILEEYVPTGINTCSPHQIEWDAPSPSSKYVRRSLSSSKLTGSIRR